MSDEPIALVCIRVGTATRVTIGTTVQQCHRCQTAVFASPTSLAAAGPKAMILCVPCALEEMPVDAKIKTLTFAQRIELELPKEPI